MADTYSYSAFIKNHTTETPHSSYFSTSSNNLSFSSTLLEEIYRSIDLGEDEEVTCRESMRKKRSDDANMRTVFKTEEEMANYQRACMIEKWMEKKVTEKIIVRGKSTADLQMKMSRKDRQYSSSSSSDSSCGGGFFSSSEAESAPVVHRPKPVRTGFEPGINLRNFEIDRRERLGVTDQSEQKPKHQSGFLKTKSRALKIYGDLKKVKQPISPGGKVAAFLNSIFTAGNLKKPKIAAACDLNSDSPSLKSACSSASSLSRSCLSKTNPSSKFSGGVKRSVRFSPVSLIVDEDCHNKDNDNVDFIKTAIDEEHMVHIMENNRRVLKAAGDFLMNYQKKDEFELPLDHLKKINVGEFEEGEEEEEEEELEVDAESYASSDLFELDNLSSIGMERYRQELPVYETTHLDKIQTMQIV